MAGHAWCCRCLGLCAQLRSDRVNLAVVRMPRGEQLCSCATRGLRCSSVVSCAGPQACTVHCTQCCTQCLASHVCRLPSPACLAVVLASCKALGTPEAGTGEARDVKPEPESEDLYLSQHLPQIGNFLLDEAHARRCPQHASSSPSTASTFASQFAQTASSCSQDSWPMLNVRTWTSHAERSGSRNALSFSISSSGTYGSFSPVQ